MPVTIRDVAKAAGVAYGTVSRAFNGYSDINDETKQRILAVAKEMGYVPNLNAKRLSGKGNHTLAIILAGFLADRGLTDELVIKLLRGACTYASNNGIEVAVYVLSSEQQNEKTFEQFCNEHSLSGALCFGLKTTDAYYENLKNSRISCVTVDVEVKGDQIGYVGTNDVKAFEDIANLVYGFGHRRIVFLNGRENAEVCELRRRGLINVLSKHQITLEEEYYTDFVAENAKKYVTDYIGKHGKDAATAFICASDLIAIGACNAITKCGFSVGKDFTVTGFDGLHIAGLFEPAITTVDQNMTEKGFAAAKMLHSIIEGKEAERHQYIPYTLVQTESIGKLV